MPFAAAAASLSVAAQLVLVLKALVDCAKACDSQPADERRRRSSFVRVAGFIPLMLARLSASAGRMLTHDWDAFEPWKSKVRLLSFQLDMKTFLPLLLLQPASLISSLSCTLSYRYWFNLLYQSDTILYAH